MSSATWWYNLTYRERIGIRIAMKADTMTAEQIDKAFEIYG